MSQRLFHIAPAPDWEEAKSRGAYRPASLDSEGFIHLSTEEQWLRVANTFYRDRDGLLLLELDEGRLGEALRWDRVGDERFPHLYGPLEVSSIVAVHPLVRDDEGAFVVPPGVRGVAGPPAP